MIIKREFIPFLELYNNDTEIREFIDVFFADENVDGRLKEHYKKYLKNTTYHERELGWAIPADYNSSFTNLLEHLDKTKPYQKSNCCCLINREKLQKYLDAFKQYVESNPGGYPFRSFEGNTFLYNQEEYKTNIYHDVKRAFINSKVTEKDVGTGKIIKLLEFALNKCGNLIYHFNKIKFTDKINEGVSQPKVLFTLERIFYNLYFGNGNYSDKELFETIKDIFGGNYDVIAYLFYLKDYTQYFPIRSSSFDDRFKTLDIYFETSGKCSWENYKDFCSIILQVREYMEEYYGFSVRPIDAHSFVWQLPCIHCDVLVEFDSEKQLEKEREAKTTARIGQGEYRMSLRKLWGDSCSVTGCSNTDFLIASHIKPWRDCTENNEWLNPFNGLLLTPNLDSAFDQGYITFDDVGYIVVSSQLNDEECEILGITKNMKLRFIRDEHKPFLKYHKEKIFRG